MQATGTIGVSRNLQEEDGQRRVRVSAPSERQLLEEILVQLKLQNRLLMEAFHIEITEEDLK